MTKTHLKVHAFDSSSEDGMPDSVARGYHAQGLRGTACGYMRLVSFDLDQVTCIYCRRKLQLDARTAAAAGE